MPRNPSRDGELYRLFQYARCDGCRTWWRKHVECRYHVMNRAGDGLPYETGYGEHVRDLSEWERSPEAGSSFALWTNYDWEDPDAIKCPTCRAARAQEALDLDADQEQAPAAASPEEAIQRHLDAVLTPDVLDALDTRLGTVAAVEWLKARGIDAGPVPWNRLANNATGRAWRHQHRNDPQPGEQLALI